MENNENYSRPVLPVVPIIPMKAVTPEMKEAYAVKGTEEEISFEEAMERLDEIDQLLKSGRAPLADSLALFEEGAGLLKKCNELLEQAELKVQTLLPN